MKFNNLVNICLLTTTLSGCMHYNKHHQLKSDSPSYEKFGLRVTDSYALGGLSAGNTIQYNGMNPSDSVFFVSEAKSERAVNIPCPTSDTLLYFFGKELDIIKVTKDSLILGRER